jgi:hypothetical protein
MTQQYRSGPQGSWEQPRRQYSAPQQNPHRRPLAPVGAWKPQQVRGANPPQPFPRQPSQPPAPTAPTSGLSILSAVLPERALRTCVDGVSGSVGGAANTGRTGQEAQDAGTSADTAESHQDAAHRELQNDNVDAAPRCSPWVRLSSGSQGRSRTAVSNHDLTRTRPNRSLSPSPGANDK